MNPAKIYEKKLMIPTYEVGQEEKNPMFFEKRVYQGSSGKVYPNAVIEKICDEKIEKEYNAVILENDWLYVVVLPELGGRIYTAYDKTNDYDFVYHNRVIKPALVGLLGPWISGGIEFNWPQHHRPTTFMPVNYKVVSDEKGVSVFVGEIEGMFELKHTTEIRLPSDAAYIQISTSVENRSALPQTFLWWANPAYRVNDDTKTIMPMDVAAVMDHGKRAVSSFPIATGEYYKFDYSDGVDISRYKNISVPTSFMAHKSNFDFVGGYDCARHAGLLHVSDHHTSPGKKQWTWGNGDFGVAWDRNLTDEDGPYVELMTGCFTDNQPDFTFIAPSEEKHFTQYFMPFHDIESIYNANKDICCGVEGGNLNLYSNIFCTAMVSVKVGDELVVNKEFNLSPISTHKLCTTNDTDNVSIIITYNGKKLEFNGGMVEKFDIPSPATPCPTPKECATTEELYICGLHIEQYRHATRLAEDYYLEGLSREGGDIRLNSAYGLLLLRRGLFRESLQYFDAAVATMTLKNTNTETCDAIFYKALSHFYLGEKGLAYDNFFRCIWSNGHKSEAYYYLAAIAASDKDFETSLEHVKASIISNGANAKALHLLGRIYEKMGNISASMQVYDKAIAFDKLDALAVFEKDRLNQTAEKREKNSESGTASCIAQGCSCGGKAEVKSNAFDNVSVNEILNLVSEYFDSGKMCRARAALKNWQSVRGNHPMVSLYLAYVSIKKGDSCDAEIREAIESSAQVVFFPSRLYDVIVLRAIQNESDNYLVNYYLGNLFYDKKQYDMAAQLWHKSAEQNTNFPTVRRNLSLYYFNKKKDEKVALQLLENAFSLDKKDSRVTMELFQLYKIVGKSEQQLFAFLKENLATISERDDLYIEYINLTALNGDLEKAEELILSRKFHPWEGGEGKVTKLYKMINCSLAEKFGKANQYEKAIAQFERCLQFPHNFGEGKLILDYDNDVFFLMGQMAESNADLERARKCFEMATRGSAAVADDMYYNDNPIEYIYYMALAFKKLASMSTSANDKNAFIAKANSIKNAFNNYYESHINKKTVIDYFAVSLPDMLIWEQDIDKRNVQFCEHVKALASKI